MEWTSKAGQRLATWSDGRLEASDPIAGWIETFAERTAMVSPIPTVDIPSGFTDDTSAWATITEALRFVLGDQVLVPDPPEDLAPEGPQVF